VTKTGFATLSEDVELLVGQVATVNGQLKTGSISEVIEVLEKLRSWIKPRPASAKISLPVK